MIKYDNIEVKQSPIEGVGLFSKKKFKKGDIIHTDIALYLPDMTCSNNTLESYVIQSDLDYYSLIAMGPTSFLNDAGDESNVYLVEDLEEHKTHTTLSIVADRDIQHEEELTLDYDNVLFDD